MEACYNSGQINAPAMLATSESVAELVTGLKENKSDMSKDSTPVFSSSKLNNLDAEEWRPVVGYEGWYEVSSFGRVRRVKATCGTRVGKILKQTPNPSGYPSVKPSRNGRSKVHSVYELVAFAFLGERPEGYEINHIDGIKTNSHVSNLEYVTPSENRQHAVDMGLLVIPPERRARGERIGSAKLTPESVAEIKRLLSDGKCQRLIASQFGVTPQSIHHIKTGRTWRHV